MANKILTVKEAGTIIAKLSAGILQDKSQFIKSIDKEGKRSFDSVNGYKPGDEISVRLPARFEVNDTADITGKIQSVSEGKVPLVLNHQDNIPIEATSKEIATDLDLKDWAKRILEPQMITMANVIEAKAIREVTSKIYNNAGASSSYDTDHILKAGQFIDEGGNVDFDSRFVLLNTAAMNKAVSARKGLFQSSEQISKQYRSGAMGIADGFTFLKNNLLATHKNGNDTSGITVKTTVTTEGASSIVLTGFTASTGTITKGTTFKIAGVKAVHPTTYESFESDAMFVATADGLADASGDITVSVSPAIFSTGTSKNVSKMPTALDVVTIDGGDDSVITQNLAYHKSAFRFCSVPLVKPDGVDLVAQETVNGITIRVVRAYDIVKDRMIMRIDCLWGIAAVRPEWAARL